MSAPFRNQLMLLHQEAHEHLAHPKNFPLPARIGSLSQYHANLRSILPNIDLEIEEVSEFIRDISKAHDSWVSTRTSMTGTERAADTPLYEAFVIDHPYLTTLANLKKYQKGLKTSRQAILSALPDSTQSTNSLIHLPKLSLPKFSGQPVEYLSFSNTFNAGVDQLTGISDSVKFTYLKECLDGAALLLIKSLPITDASYQEALRLLKENFGSDSEINRSLHHSLRKLPVVHSNKPQNLCTELRSFVDQFENLYLYMLEQRFDVDAIPVQIELESKLPPAILEEIFKEREAAGAGWTTDKFRTALKTILRRKEGIKAIRDQQKELEPPQQKAGKPSKNSDSQGNQSQQNSQNSPHSQSHLLSSNEDEVSSSLTFATQQKGKGKPNLPCLFCDVTGHFSPYCPSINTFEARQAKVKQLKRCFKCLKADHFSQNCPKPAHCSFCKGKHPRALCKKGIEQAKQPSQQGPSSHSTHISQAAKSQNQQPHNPPNNISIPPTPLPTFNPLFYPQYAAPNPSYPLTFNSPMPHSVPYSPSPIGPPPKPDCVVESKAPPQTNAATNSQSSPLPILLKCVRGTIFNPDNPKQSFEGIIALDDCSTHSYVKAQIAEQLNLALSPSAMNLGVFGNPQCKSTPSFATKVGVKLINGSNLIINANTMTHLTQPTHFVPFHADLIRHEFIPLTELVMPILLVGADYYYDIEPTPMGRLPSGYTFVQSLLGPLVAGKAFAHSTPPIATHITNFCQSFPMPPPDYFSLESIGIRDEPMDQSNDDFTKKFVSQIEYTDGRYQVKLPFKEDPSTLSLPSNFPLAYGRLNSVLNSLQSNPTMLAKYNEIFQEQLDMGIIEEVKDPSKFSIPLHYIPHHPVLRADRSKPPRIVYDGSAKTGNFPALNDCLWPGPVILPSLIGMLLRFRLPKYAVIGDIMKAFLQILIHPSHRDALRFLWVKDIAQKLSRHNLKIFRSTKLPFGLVCSPFILAITILLLLKQFPSPLATQIALNIYVDNLLLLIDDILTGQKNCAEVIKLFARGKFILREFASNCPEILAHIPAENRLPGFVHKFLGLIWDTQQDAILMRVNKFMPPTDSISKSDILSFLASHFDPMGFLTPLLLPLKIHFQSLWPLPCKWKDPLPKDVCDSWFKVLEEWTDETTICIPRTFPHCPPHFFELHAFSDASLQAMCTCVYLRISTTDAKSNVILLFSKTKVKPISKKGAKYNIHRMELVACLMGAKALTFVFSQLSHSFSINSSLNLWTDSSVSLAWLNSSAPIREVFIANRLKPIRSIPNLFVRHVAGKENPADIGSRPNISSPKLLSAQSTWWVGPEWLSLPKESWPKPTPNISPFISNDFSPNDPNKFFTFNTIQVDQIRVIDISRFSRLPKLLRVTIFVLKFIYKLKPNFISSLLPISPPNFNSSPTIAQYRFALSFLLRIEQQIFPPSDSDNESLGIFSDENLLLRSEGRIQNSDFPLRTKNPIYLPPQSHLTALIVFETHVNNLHISPAVTLSHIRRQFWLPKGRRHTNHYLHKMCFPCRRFSAKPFNLPKFPPLPADRVNPSIPFAHVGVDFAGPLKLFPTHSKADSPPQKYYILLWVCLSTRALALDITENLSAPSFLLAFRRFSARYGPPQSIHSDNAPTFISVFNNLKTHYPSLVWHFRAPLSPWKGGHYEIFVKLAKFHLRRAFARGLYPKTFSFDFARTIFAEIEFVVNSRPIGFDSANPNDPRPLTPLHFLRPLGPHSILPSTINLDGPFVIMPNGDFQSNPLISLWQNLSKITTKFWAKWQTDYLLSLRERFKKITQPSNRTPSIGELVLVADPNSPISLWRPALILQIFHNSNNVADTAKVRMANGKTTVRSVSQLFPLETTEEFSQRHNNPPSPLPTQTTAEKAETILPDNNSPPRDFLKLRSRKIPR